jgi:hypothetical protein
MSGIRNESHWSPIYFIERNLHQVILDQSFIAKPFEKQLAQSGHLPPIEKFKMHIGDCGHILHVIRVNGTE